MCLFFFSSRRRHTRCYRDWSSDVCSSDLAARVEYHRHLDMLETDAGEHELVMRASTIEYLAPARFDDLIEVFVRVSRIGRTSVTYECAAYLCDDDVLMVTAQQTLVLVDLAERRARRIPDELRERIRTFEGDDLES